MVRGAAVHRVSGSRRLHASPPGPGGHSLFVAAIAPQQLKAQTVSCVALPARDGVVREFVPVDSVDMGVRVAEALDPAGPCPKHGR